MFNARADTVTERASFRKLIAGRRCAFICNGFYEWKEENVLGKKVKQPYAISFAARAPREDEETAPGGEAVPQAPASPAPSTSHPASPVMFLAGLYDIWKNAAGEEMFSCTVLTTDASKRFIQLHDRMPVFLSTPAEIDEWIAQKPLSDTRIQAIADPQRAPALDWIPVSTRLNKLGQIEGPDCVKPIRDTGAASVLEQLFKASPKTPASGVQATAQSPSSRKRAADSSSSAARPAKRGPKSLLSYFSASPAPPLKQSDSADSIELIDT